MRMHHDLLGHLSFNISFAGIGSVTTKVRPMRSMWDLWDLYIDIYYWNLVQKWDLSTENYYKSETYVRLR